MGKSPMDHALSLCVGSPHAQTVECPQTLIDMMPSADEYIARLKSLMRDFMPPDPLLTCTTMKWWIDRGVAHLCTRDTHTAHPTIQ